MRFFTRTEEESWLAAKPAVRSIKRSLNQEHEMIPAMIMDQTVFFFPDINAKWAKQYALPKTVGFDSGGTSLQVDSVKLFRTNTLKGTPYEDYDNESVSIAVVIKNTENFFRYEGKDFAVKIGIFPQEDLLSRSPEKQLGLLEQITIIKA